MTLGTETTEDRAVSGRRPTTAPILLEGCQPEPIAHYLKALAVLRLVSEQLDPTVRGSWTNRGFRLLGSLSRAALIDFFLDRYSPTPIVAPWNGGSGFYEKDKKDGIDAIDCGQAARFEPYRQTIAAARRALETLELEKKPKKDDKTRLLTLCRSTFPDVAVEWLDAAFVLLGQGDELDPKYPPLLGTGGNDGRLEFTNNLMQRLTELFDGDTGAPMPGSRAMLTASLFDQSPTVTGISAAIGQYLPSGAGGANAATDYDGNSNFNPWDFVFTLEGALMFAAAAVKRMGVDEPGVLSYPFTVRATGAGYGTASLADEGSSRGEIWLPIWREPASASTVEALLSEGRARVGRRSARNGIDFARAAASLGVDRGIDAFSRFGFHVRNGLSYFATPLRRIPVANRRRPEVDLLMELDGWLERMRYQATSETAPASVASAWNKLELAIFELCQQTDGASRLQDVFVGLGVLEAQLATSSRWAMKSVSPIPPLSLRWINKMAQVSGKEQTELRIAAALSSIRGRRRTSKGLQRYPFRQSLEPVDAGRRRSDKKRWARWNEQLGNEVVWTTGSLIRGLNAIMSRRLMQAVRAGQETWTDDARFVASLSDVAAFVAGQVDDELLGNLLRACALLDWTDKSTALSFAATERGGLPDAFYAMMKLCFPGQTVQRRLDDHQTLSVKVPIVPTIHQLAANGRGTEASQQAARRLRGSGLPPVVDSIWMGRSRTSESMVRRAAAALMIPISSSALNTLARSTLRDPQA